MTDSRVLKNIMSLGFISVVLALQLTIIVALITSFIPFHATTFVQKIFPVYLPEVRPEREMFLYRIFIILALVIQATAVFITRRQISENEEIFLKIRRFALMGLGWVVIEIAAVFKLLLWGESFWARGLLYASMAMALLTQVFYPETLKLWGALKQRLIARSWRVAFLLGVIGLILLCLWPADINHVLGRIMLRDQFYHLDSLIMAPGFAYAKGQVLNIDVTSQYSTLLPIVMRKLAVLCGGFDYTHVLWVLVVMVLAYYIVFFVSACAWLDSLILGACAVLLLIKWQMFHWGVAPLSWAYPSALALRHWPDLLFLWAIWLHGHTHQKRFLFMAAVISGFTLSWMMDVGTYMHAALLCYTVWHLYKSKINVPMIAVTLLGLVGIAVLVMFHLLWLAQPQAVFQAQYWRNQFEFAAFFVQGWGALPMTQALAERQYLAFLIGFSIPVFYVFTLIHTWMESRQKKTDVRQGFILLLCVYGLGLYHYFIHRSGVNSFHAVSMPLVVLLMLWIKRLLDIFRSRVLEVRLVLLLGCGLFFMTGYLFVYYPNVLNLGRLNWQQEGDFYKTQFDFTSDASLIAKNTKALEPVALISSFETKILMQADRKPFFYYFPLVESSLMGQGEVRKTYIQTKPRLAKILNQLTINPPRVIFIQEEFVKGNNQEGIRVLMAYIRQHYVPSTTGTYLRMYERKD